MEKLPVNHGTVFITQNRRRGSFVLVTTVVVFWLLSSWRFLHASRVHLEDDKFHVYPGEKIAWKPCGSIDAHDVECSSVTVPMDQFNKTNFGDKIFNIPLIRLRGNNATQNILLNPGGPGAGGVDFVRDFGKQLQSIIGENFHLVGFDPRGVGSSTPMASCYPNDEIRSKLSQVRHTDVIRDSPEMYAWAGNFAQACENTMGEQGHYVNTPQTAADMNNIIDALGQDDMMYWGFSYGSVLGQTYATLYPHRSRRILIDGIADQVGWFEELLDVEAYSDTDRVLLGFFEECIKAGDACALNGAAAAKSATELSETVKVTINRMRSNPIGVYVNSSLHGVLADSQMWYDGIFRQLYQPQAWPRMAEVLAQLLKGNATEAFLTYGQGDTLAPIGESYRIVTLNDGLSGPQNWPKQRQDLLRLLLPFFDKHFFSQAAQLKYYMKQRWTVTRTHTYKPQKRVQTAHPMLILSTTYDPVCPLRSAKNAQQIFEGSRLVEVQAYGHCSLAMPSSCASQFISDYLNKGILPKTNVKCGIDVPYFGGKQQAAVVAAPALLPFL